MFSKISRNSIFKKAVSMSLALLLLIGVFISMQRTVHAGVIKGETDNQQRAAIYYTYTQDKDTCKTILKVRLRVYATGSEYSTYKNDALWSLTYDGTTKTGTKNYECPDSGEYVNISNTYSTTIIQKNGAATDVKLSGWINLSGTSVGGKLSVNDTITLPKFQPSTAYSSKTVSGTIVWDDGEDRDGKRPDSVTVTLYRNGDSFKSKTAKNSFKWTGLYTYASGGEKYNYTVKGSSVTGYTMSVSGTTITYTHKPVRTDIIGKIIWKDDNNRDGLRPDEVYVHLVRNGEIQKSKVVSNNEYAYTGWYLYHDGGKKYTFSVKGDELEGYTMSISGTTITYTHNPETTNIKGSVIWDDDENKNGTRPDSVIVSLLENGVVKETIATKASENWSYDFGTKYVYNNGNQISYQISVPEVSGYLFTIKDYDITYAVLGRLGVIFGFSI